MKRDQKWSDSDNQAGARTQHQPKTTWHPLSLQQLHQTQFIDVVNGILSGRNELFQGSLKGASGTREGDDLLLATHWD